MKRKSIFIILGILIALSSKDIFSFSLAWVENCIWTDNTYTCKSTGTVCGSETDCINDPCDYGCNPRPKTIVVSTCAGMRHGCTCTGPVVKECNGESGTCVGLSGTCTYTCSPGWENCDGDLTTGCEYFGSCPGTTPTYSNVGSDKTLIGPGDPVKIFANWTDDTALNIAWLWTNETGSNGKNYTDGTYNSPITLSGKTDWSNFTWQNENIKSGVIAWRIYANDTSGNENVTSMGTFQVVSIYNFEVWTEGPGFFTTGTPRIVNIYVKNSGNIEDSYNVTYNKEVINPIGANNLVQISIPSNRINSVKAGRVDNTFATVTLLGPVGNAEIWFNVTSINNQTMKITQKIKIGSAYPISLPEFQLIGFLLLLILSTLIISYPFHFRH